MPGNKRTRGKLKPPSRFRKAHGLPVDTQCEASWRKPGAGWTECDKLARWERIKDGALYCTRHALGWNNPDGGPEA